MMSFDYKKYKALPKISSIIVLIAFFLPFFLIKCNGQTLASINGVRLCIGTEVGSNGNTSSSDSEIIEPKAFASVGLLAAIGCVVLAFVQIKKRHLMLLIAASLGLVSLLVLNLNMSMALGDLDSSKKMITIEMGMGYYLAFLSFLSIVIFCGIALKGENQAAIQVPPDDLVDNE